MNYKNFILMVMFIFIVFLAINVSSVYAWWDPSFQYRRTITIDNTGNSNTLTDYQVFVNVTYDSGMQSDFDDLRFVDSDDTTKLNYWIENKVDGSYAEVWVKIPNIPANNNKTIYMYYGNVITTTESNPFDTFTLFDDWSAGSASPWTLTGSHITEDRTTDYRVEWDDLYENVDEYLYKYFSDAPQDFVIEFTAEVTADINRADLSIMAVSDILDDAYNFDNGIFVWFRESPSDDYNIQLCKRESDSLTCNNTDYNYLNDDIWLTLTKYGNEVHLEAWSDSAKTNKIVDTTLSVSLPTLHYFYSVTTANQGYAQGTDGWGDDYKLRKYTEPEPTCIIGEEETQTGEPEITIFSPLNTIYPTNNISFTFIVIDENSTTFHVKAYLDSILLYDNLSYHNDTNVTINLENYLNDSKTDWTVKVWANDTEGLINEEIRQFTLDLFDLSAIFSNYTEFESIKYGNIINLSYSVRCGFLGKYVYVNVSVNESIIYSDIVICDNSTYLFNRSYQHEEEGNITLNITLYKTDNVTIAEENSFNYISDLNPPNITISYDFNYGFRKNANENINILVNDSISPFEICNISILNTQHNNTYFNDNSTSYDFDIEDGINTFSVICKDIVNNINSKTEKIHIYKKNITLVYEDNGSVFNSFSEMETLRAISEKTQEIFNFLENNDTWILFISNQSDVIRIEKRYSEDPNSLLYIDLNLDLIDTTTRTCVAKTQQFYEIVFYSSTNKPIAVVNNLAQCYVLADYTKYAYQDALMAKAYTIKALYYLYTYENQKVFLATLDGSVATSVNLDVLESTQKTYTFTLTTDDISVSKISNTTLKIYYKNLADDNIKTEIYIYDGNNLLFSHIETETPNEFTIYFDYSSINLQNNVLKLIVKKSTQSSQAEITRIFTLQGAVGLIDKWLAIFISAFLIFFGLTFVAARHVFGYFGIITMIIALAITTLAPATIEITFIQTIIVIILIFIVLVYKEEYAKIT